MRSFIRLATGLFAFFLTVQGIEAQVLSPVEVAKRGKAAMAYVVTSSTSSSRSRSTSDSRRGRVDRNARSRFGGRTTSRSGSAFCVHPAGLFLTNARAVSGHQQGRVQLILDAGLETQRLLSAQVVREDPKLDLALIWIPDEHSAKPLPFALDKAEAKQEVITLGYQTSRSRFSSRSSPTRAIIKMTNLVSNGQPGTREELQPKVSTETPSAVVLNREGTIVGMLAQSGDNGQLRLLHHGQIKKFLQGPIVAWSLPELATENIHEPFEFRAQILSMDPDTKLQKAELALEMQSPLEQKARRYLLKKNKELYQIMTAPIPISNEPVKLKAYVAFNDGQLQGNITDRTIKVLDNDVKLSTIEQIQIEGDRIQLTLTDGQRMQMETKNFPELTVEVAGQSWKLPLANTRQMSITGPDPIPELKVKLIAKSEGKESILRETTIAIRTPRSSRSGFTSRSPSSVNNLVEMLFTRSDRNGDGVLDFNEAPTSLQRFDLNGDRLISRSEMQRYVDSRFSGSDPARRFGGRDPSVPPFGGGGRGARERR